MCGLFGFVLKANIPQEIRQRIVTLLAYEMDHRGGDSYGYWNDVTGVVDRGLGHATYKIGTSQFKKTKVLLAHTRFGTTGAVTIPNCHPFEIGDIIGAHNGIVHNYIQLNHRYKREFEVDSMHIFAHLNEKKPLKEVDAYGAITFINKRDLTNKNSPHIPVYLGKFNHGQLCIAGFGKVESPEGLVWCSDETDLKRILNYSEREFFIYKVENESLYEIENFNLLKLGVKLNFGKETRAWTTPSCETGRNFVNNQPNIPGRQITGNDDFSYWHEEDEACYMCAKPLFSPCGHCAACVSCCLCGVSVRNLDESSDDATKLLLLKKIEDSTSSAQIYDIVEVKGKEASPEIAQEDNDEVLDYSALINRDLSNQEQEQFMKMRLD